MSVRVGFLGCGFIARYHAMQLRLSGVDHELVAAHDPAGSRAGEFTAAEGGEAVDSVAAVVDRSDAVFVCTWTASHLDDVTAAVDAGCSVLCEKPLGVDLTDATATAEVLSRAPVQMVGLVLRSSPALLALRELVSDPAAGRVMNVVFRDDQYLPIQGMYRSDWRADPSRAGSGVLLEHSIHDMDLLEWLAGPLEVVAGQDARFHGLAGIEDSVSVLGRHRGGATSTLSSVWHDVLARPSQRRIEVFCEHRLVTLEGDVFGPVHLHSDEHTSTLDGDDLVAWLASRGVSLVSAEAEFLGAVAAHLAGGSPPRLRPDAADALRAHVLVDAVYRSCRGGGGAVEVPAP